ncbi:MAG TPA: nucleotidyl transferase AbiEii/AbiGii toxin family protein [Candidatus Cloacimonadota bacterium]|nr:nucleotidyl transferase AbiEii/AbiGii toxin family protein [Candidatus Cloacimonadota bacterium]
MNSNPLFSLLAQNPVRTPNEFRRVLRDKIQKICLLGLWRSGFFEHAAFYGGTALRMLYGLDRFSEDLDFSLLAPKPEFRLSAYLDSVQRELQAWSIEAEVNLKQKQSSQIESAFIKANTLKILFGLKVPALDPDLFHRDELISVKFELDLLPPCAFETESKFLLEPMPFNVSSMGLPDLFAGKMHAVLARSWKNRVKGRDWYDLIWFVQQAVPLKLGHLEARLKQSGHLSPELFLDHVLFQSMLADRINNVNFEQAKADVLPFIPNPDSLTGWSGELFTEISSQIIVSV